MMQVRVAALDSRFAPNPWLPMMAAMAFHAVLLVWDPTILKASHFELAAPISIRMMDHLPVLEAPKPPPPVVKKVEEKKPAPKPVKKAKKSGLSLSAKSQPAVIAPHKPAKVAPVAPKPFVSKISMPKFTPRDSDMPIAASPMPGMAPASSRRAVSPMVAPPALRGKSRGVRADSIPFQLSDRGSSPGLGAASHVVAIPIGEERGEIAALPSAPIIQEAPRGRKGVAGYRFLPGEGSGSGELTGKDKGGHIGFHGVAKADRYVEGSISGTNGTGKGGTVVAGKGFEIGGPVGDRKITRRKLPQYPAWAEEKGITAMVKIYFTVKSDGSIRSNMRIMQSSGYAELDDLAKAALKEWKFSATSADSSESASWGMITFRFTLA